MAFFLDSVQSLATRARNAFRSDLPGTDAWIFPNNVAVSAKVFAGLVWGLFGTLARVDKNRFIMSADADSVQRYGNEYGLVQGSSTYAQGSIDVQCKSPLTIPAGTIFTYLYGQTLYTYKSTVAVAAQNFPVPTATVVSVPVVAQQVGKTANALAGTPFNTSFNGAGTCTVGTGGINGGTNGESLDDYRIRVLNRRQKVPAGGSENDYVQWMLGVSGVTRAWAVGNLYGPGTIGCFFLMDDTYTFGLPTAADVAVVQAYVNSVAPVTAKAIVLAPVAVPVQVVVTNLYPDTAEVRSAGALELQSVFRRMVGVSVPTNQTVLYQSWLWRAVSNAAGEQHHTILAPAADLTLPPGQLPILQSVTFSG